MTNDVSALIPCPECGSQMALRTGRYGRYYRCTNPDCGKTAPVSTGIPCPVCKEGTLVEKYSQKRRAAFYGCSNYPVCRFAVSDSPIKVCPTCEKGVLTAKGETLRCSNKDCSYSEDLGSK
jgi:DNA topoisomerase-1